MDSITGAGLGLYSPQQLKASKSDSPSPGKKPLDKTPLLYEGDEEAMARDEKLSVLEKLRNESAATLRKFSPLKKRSSSTRSNPPFSPAHDSVSDRNTSLDLSPTFVPPPRFDSLRVPDDYRVKVELTQIPATFTEADIAQFFLGWEIEEDIELKHVGNFSYPLSAAVFFKDPEHAEDAVAELNGTWIGGRCVQLKVIDKYKDERKAREVKRISEELKKDIIDHARANNPLLSSSILEVRELSLHNQTYAFLQARAAIPAINPFLNPGVALATHHHALLAHNVGKWELVQAGSAAIDADRVKSDDSYNSKVEALKDLLYEVGRLDKLKGVWEQWEGSWKMNMDGKMD
ncbi:unnamed protein product [Periconia digitata]|uniref:RRM domain-containing protein n=1 Tax=Periconia digitata TaxID=1303443 RepID=A0A9W4UBR3_9PLEO|nr:unnamed protein product [Periconia digitata]